MIWVDAQFSPAIATWIANELGQPAQAIRELGLRDAKDRQIFDAARQANAIVMTKDADFVELVERLGPPPRVVWVTCGNTSNAALKVILRSTLNRAVEMLGRGDKVVEISGNP